MRTRSLSPSPARVGIIPCFFLYMKIALLRPAAIAACGRALAGRGAEFLRESAVKMNVTPCPPTNLPPD